jgi:hypothetical protein
MSEGKAGVVRELVAGAAAEWDEARRAADGEQLPMFPAPIAKAAALERQAESEAARAAGRPPGAQNLTTREFRTWLMARGVSPLVSLMQWAMMSPQAIARELGCKPIDAFREWRILQSELAPYLHARLAFVDDKGEAVPLLQMFIGGQLAAPGAGMTPWEAREALAAGGPAALAQIEQNQGVGEAANGKSHDPQSHGDAK